MDIKTTGTYSYKKYKCDRCGYITTEGTNHWGRIYNLTCKNCTWKNPTTPFVTKTCMEKMPKGYKKPEEWKTVKLGDILKFK